MTLTGLRRHAGSAAFLAAILLASSAPWSEYWCAHRNTLHETERWRTSKTECRKGVIGGAPVILPAGSYRVETIGASPQVIEKVEVRAGELSGGERRRLELLRALVAKPKVLLCDEPLTGVDPTGIHRVGRILRQAASEGMAVLLADHRVHDALALCDAACLLLDGRIELSAEPETFLDHPEVRKRYLG